MDELTNWVKELVEKFPEPEDFLKELEKRKTPEEKKGDLFFEVGKILYNRSNFKLALEVFEKALECYIRFNDKSGESKCYRGLGAAYDNLGDFKRALV